MQFVVTADILQDLAEAASERLLLLLGDPGCPIHVYGVPRGGISAALALGSCLPNCFKLVDDPRQSDVIVDDLIDSGATLRQFEGYGKPFIALIDKREDKWKGKWIVWPWEATTDKSIEDNISRLIQFVGEDSTRGGLKETPGRVARAWQEWCSGYSVTPADVLKVFEDGAEKYDQMITVRDIPFYSHCEHLMAPFFGTVTIAYIPNKNEPRIVGLSKLSRLADIFARRLQVQERMTNQIADALCTELNPLGVGVVVKARHLCMESRGVAKQGHETITTALRGVILTEQATRAEFLGLAR